jgi:hypothetical protein
VLSYYNQPDHPLIDRRDRAALSLLLRLAAAQTGPANGSANATEAAVVEPADPWRRALATRGLPPPDARPLDAEAPATTPGWREHFVAAALPGTPEPARQRLADLGFEVVAFDAEAGWPAAFDRLAPLLGVAP